MSNINNLGLPPLVLLLQSSFWTGSVEMGMVILSGLQLSFWMARNRSQLPVWLGWAYLTKKVPRAATMPIVTAVVCFLSTQNMGS